MGFVKVVKNKAYFKRYQVKFRRRRECKTDYKQRRKLIAQDKNRYSTPKYRFVVRITNRDIICQIFSSDLSHDECLAAAYSHELKRYGVNVGLTNYAAAYCTGLLLARRINQKFKLDEEHPGNEDVDGDVYLEDDSGAFKAYLDVGLARTTTGANIFGALKGACDGGVHIPHNYRRFPGSYREEGDEGKKVWQFEPEAHRARIFGQHVAEYMRHVEENGEEGDFQKLFGKYVELGLGPDDLEAMYESAHASIRADPQQKRGELERGYFEKDRSAPKRTEHAKKSHNRSKISSKQRWNRVRQRYANLTSA